MAVYIGGKKIKELYYGGKKIKEAWYGGKKVYSNAGAYIWPWTDKKDYKLWELAHSNGTVYECIAAHTSDTGTSKPGEGWDEYSYWRRVGYASEYENIRYFPWKLNEYYSSLSVVEATVNGVAGTYECLKYNKATTSNHPGGPEGTTYWRKI